MKTTPSAALYQNTGLRVSLIEEICALAQKHQVEKVLLFGSRARGDWKDRSDIDLAAYGGNMTLFSLDVDDETHTLLQFDVVDLGRSVQQELRDEIQKDGMVIYEKSPDN